MTIKHDLFFSSAGIPLFILQHGDCLHPVPALFFFPVSLSSHSVSSLLYRSIAHPFLSLFFTPQTLPCHVSTSVSALLFVLRATEAEAGRGRAGRLADESAGWRADKHGCSPRRGREAFVRPVALREKEQEQETDRKKHCCFLMW